MGTNSGQSARRQVWIKDSVSGITVYRSPLLDRYSNQVSHAFTTRLGGESKPPLDSFNLGRHIEDEELRENAMCNRATLCLALDANFESLIVPGQKHTANVVEVTSESKQSLKDVDGVMTKQVRLPLLLHFADCVPIMLFDPVEHALCLIHAGWRGTAQTIVRRGVSTMIATYGSKPANIVAAIGPAIGPCCYPTSKEVALTLSKTVSGFDDLITGDDRTPHPDLQMLNAMQLSESNVTKMDLCDLCTACNSHIFYSHRQSGGITGRQGAFAQLI